MFRLTIYAASEGDCLVLARGEESDPHHSLIDLGRQGDFKCLRPWFDSAPRIDLFTISHVNADHIAGGMPMYLQPAPFAPADVWFNGFIHLADAKTRLEKLEAQSIAQGNKLQTIIKTNGWPWNRAFGESPVSVDGPVGGAAIEWTASLTVTLLSPADADLYPDRENWLYNESLLPGNSGYPPLDLEVMGHQDIGSTNIHVAALVGRQFKEDDKAPNGSSFSILAEFAGQRVLRGADALPMRILAPLAASGFGLRASGFGPDNRLKLDQFKQCHHGAAGNTSADLL